MGLWGVILLIVVGWFVLWVFIVEPIKNAINKPKENAQVKAKRDEIILLKSMWNKAEIAPYDYYTKMQRLTYLTIDEKREIFNRIEEEIFDFYVANKTPNEQKLKEWNIIVDQALLRKDYQTVAYFKNTSTWREDFHDVMYQKHHIQLSALVDYDDDSLPYQHLINAAMKRLNYNDRIESNV